MPSGNPGQPRPNRIKQFCVHGHDTFIVGRTSSGACVECSRDSNRKQYYKNPQKAISRTLKWQQDNPKKVNERNYQWREENFEKAKKCSDEWRKSNIEYIKEYKWEKRGIVNPDGSKFTVVNYNNLYKLQQGKCAICGRHQSEFKNALHVDHDHKTGIVRGLLCAKCNTMIGRAFDNKQLFLNAIKYLN